MPDEEVLRLQKEINKKFGEGTMMLASDPSLEIERVPCGILSIDFALGGGFARGRHAEIFGPYSVGKTYTALKLIANAQDMGMRCSYVDVEGTFDPKFAEHVGVDIESLAIHRQKHGNRVVDFMETLLRSELIDVIVMDSIAALLPKSEYESDMEAGNYGTQQAILMSRALRKLTAANKRTIIVYLNQTRESVGGIFQKKMITSGGRAMGFYAGTRLEMIRIENIKRKAMVIDPQKGEEKEQEVVKAHRVKVRIDKDKTGGAIPQSETTFVFDYDLGGVDHIEDLIYLGRRLGLIEKKTTSWWVEGYEDEKQVGRPAFKKWLRKNKAVQEELEESISKQAEEEEE